jgi:arginine/lysine/ornithine decarboxylase
MFRALSQYLGNENLPFHMPGHKQGRMIPKEMIHNLLKFDLTELYGLDNLHFPEGVIKEAQCAAANAVGATETFFLVNGSTAGILASILSVVGSEEKLIVGRDCHRSVLHALTLSGGIPVYVKPHFLQNFGISGCVDVKSLHQTMLDHPDAKAVLITRPTYYGVCSDISKICEIAHEKGLVLIVDEAHGAHLPYSNRLPKSAIDAGADLVVQSAHKTLPSLTQTAYLHLNGERVDRQRIMQNLRMLQSSSPSYIFLMFLDFARAYMENEGKVALDHVITRLDGFRETFKELDLVRVLAQKDLREGSLDPTRLTIQLSDTGKTGFQMEKIFREEHNIHVELSDLQNIVCIVTVADGELELNRLKVAIAESVKKHFVQGTKGQNLIHFDFEIPQMALTPKSVSLMPYEFVQLQHSVGKICKYTITPYPPGIPYLCPGEMFSKELVECVKVLKAYGAKIDGLNEDNQVAVVT